MIYLQQRPRPLHSARAFSISPILPGRAVPDRADHGYGPFARFDLCSLAPGTLIPMHEHRNDEIVTYMTAGTLRHADSGGSSFDVTTDNLMVMNAGAGFRHEERVPLDGPVAEWLQIFVRPRAPDLAPQAQLVDRPPAHPGEWRLLAGDEASGAPTTVRSAVHIYDASLERRRLALPALPGRDAYVHVVAGTASIGNEPIAAGEGALLTREDAAEVKSDATRKSRSVAAASDAPVTHAGTIGR